MRIGYARLSAEQAHFLFEIVAARYESSPILLTSNTSFVEWGTLLGNEVLATALLDRLLHHAEVLSINGKSYRMKGRMPLAKPSSPASLYVFLFTGWVKSRPAFRRQTDDSGSFFKRR